MEEWKTYKVGDVAECLLGKMLDQKKNHGQPHNYIGNVAVRWGAFDVDPSQTMLFENEELERYSIQKGDIVMCEGGEPGRCAIWKSDDIICYQKALHRIRGNMSIVNQAFLYYSFVNNVRSGLIEPLLTGSTIKHLPREALLKMEVRLPSLATQNRIADVLMSIDDKIELNNRINHNLPS